MKNHLLITQSQLSNYGGSEVVVREISDSALSMGMDVTILTNFYGLPISKDFSPQVSVVGPDEPLDIRSFSHVWIHHNFIPDGLFDLIRAGAKLPVIAFHHMSPYVPIEAPLMPEMEGEVSSVVYFNSEETKAQYRGYFPKKYQDKLRVFGNPSPDEFDNKPFSERRLNTILVVSNHAPNELIDAVDLLKKQGSIKEYVVFGSSGIKGPVTPQVIRQFDLVVSIGKTVQYCIASNVPVFVYDHFGGSGYLTAQNLTKNKYYNFSGRGFHKMKVATIASTITDGYDKASSTTSDIKYAYGQGLLLGVMLKEFASMSVSGLYKVPEPMIDRYHRVVDLFVDQARALHHFMSRSTEMQAENKILSKQLKRTVSEMEELRRRYDNTVGRRLLKYARKYLIK